MTKSDFRFIHTADPHIDSPLRGLDDYEGAPVDEIRGATRKAFSSMVDLAVDEQVDFVLIAGDLFDGRWEDYATAIWVDRQFQRLKTAGISAFLVLGNHDAASRIEHGIRWPSNVHVFATDAATTQLIEPLGVALHGQSYARMSETNDLAKKYPARVDGFFNIGLLHTSLTGFEGHENYAPTSLATLISHRYDYWALGHVHQRSIVNADQPLICFSGNMQGRHIRETGEKGVFLVTVQSGKIVEHEFRPVDHMRWHTLEISLAPDDDKTELLEKLETEFDRLSQAADGRLVAVRVTVTGMTPLHAKTTQPQLLGQLIDEIRMAGQRSRHFVWVEDVVFRTRPVIDLDEIRESSGLQCELLRLTDAWLESIAPQNNAASGETNSEITDDELSRRLDAWLEHFENWLKSRSKVLPQDEGGRLLLNLRDAELRRQWLAESQQILINALMTGSDIES